MRLFSSPTAASINHSTELHTNSLVHKSSQPSDKQLFNTLCEVIQKFKQAHWRQGDLFSVSLIHPKLLQQSFNNGLIFHKKKWKDIHDILLWYYAGLRMLDT